MEDKILFSVDKAEITKYPDTPYKEEKACNPIVIHTEGENCDKDYDDICDDRTCRYRRINIKNGEKIWFTCGRRKENDALWLLKEFEKNGKKN